jgi:hypothetical protein
MMRPRFAGTICCLAMAAWLGTVPASAQQAPQGHSMSHASSGAPTLPGQDAFGAIQEIVQILEAETIPGGVRLTVVAKDPANANTVARIRGLGFIGLLVLGAHHQPHHLAMARGEAISGHGH